MYVQLNSQIIYYEKSGEGTPLILLHGNGESHEIFDCAIETLSKDFTVYAMDTRGHGNSATPKEYHYSDMADDVIALIESLDMKAPILFGFSDGGIIGLLVAIRRPNLLSKLIVAGANTNPKGIIGSTRRAVKADYRKTGNPLARLMLEEPNISEADLASISIPVLVLAGEHDVIKPAETKKIASNIKEATLQIIPGEDHGSYIEHSNKFASIILAWLSNKVQ